ncbi:hypothetical protein GCM10022240_07590 [Microbacterium kribbense]|uniref:Peptidase S11 D-alanyl-D-alanine carboxypeptidase A N-terminal domain-containing protein n=1 Tax=Microbacterium kribbense TaxID=433645 RepID=A0ABP7G650_9MICO
MRSADAPRALSWWDESSVAVAPAHGAGDAGAGGPAAYTDQADLPPMVWLLSARPRRSALRPGVLVPMGLIVAIVIAYCVTMIVWPLQAVAPTVQRAQVSAVTAPAASFTWPRAGAAGVGVKGFGAPAESAQSQSAIASITKVVTALLVLDRMPLKVGEQGPDFRFGYADRAQYWQYLRRNESALDVPVGGVLTQYQMMEGMLIASASNYAARLAGNLWPTDQSFASAASGWLDAHGITGITITDPTGFDPGNTATPAALIELAQQAMANPVIAEIVAKRSVTLPGAGTITNTNELLSDLGVAGLKTGTLDGYNVVAVKDITVGSTQVRVAAVALNQPDSKTRWRLARDLFAQVQTQLQATPALPAGTVVGTARTVWGERVPVVTATAASVVLWNGASATTTATIALGDHRGTGDRVGTLTATGPLNTVTVDVALQHDIDGPSPWWRITHPLQLLGVD